MGVFPSGNVTGVTHENGYGTGPRVTLGTSKPNENPPFYEGSESHNIEIQVKIYVQDPRLDPEKSVRNGRSPFWKRHVQDLGLGGTTGYSTPDYRLRLR